MGEELDPETYKQIVENSADAIIIMLDLKIVFANKTALEIYGADSPDDLIGKNALSIGLLTLNQDGRTQELEARRLKGDLNNGLFEFPATLKDGRKSVFEVNISNVPFGGKVGALCIIRDVSSRKESESRLHALHESTALLGRTTSQEEAASIVIETLSEIFGMRYAGIGFVEKDRLIFRNTRGESDTNNLPIEGPGITVKAIRTRQTQVVNDTTKDPDYLNGRIGGAQSLSELDVPIIVDGEPVAVISVEEDEPNSFDVEEVQLVEILANHFASALGRIRYNKRLVELREAHIKELVGGIDKMCIRVQEDLKGPIHTIRNSSFIIRHNPDLAMDVVDNIDTSIELMMNTLEEMKELTNPTEPDKTLVDIFSILKTAIDLCNTPRNIELVSDYDEGFLAINVDKDKIQRVFFNIIRNAIEAMPKGGVITIGHRIKDNFTEFSVTDTGMGIPDDIMEQIYQPFFSTKSHSLGLGLSFCKLAVESNGGSMSINSKEGLGTTVTIRLPL
jgi:PAS domain S-box-containing protein